MRSWELKGKEIRKSKICILCGILQLTESCFLRLYGLKYLVGIEYSPSLIVFNGQ